MKRIFIAIRIEPSVTLKSMISTFKTELKDERIKWTDAENFHLTLAFLGDTEEEKIKAVAIMLKSICEQTGEFDLILRGAGVFKNIHDPRILWTGFAPSENLDKLFESVKTGLKAADIKVEDRIFNPHLTLGRIKGITNDGILRSLITRYRDTEIQRQHISEVILYESLLFHSGPVYKPVRVFGLKMFIND